MRKGRCRELVSDPAAGLCFKHAAQHKKDRDAANVAAQLIRDTDDFTSAVTINRSLTELYKLLARDEISPRRGAVVAYTCNLLLRTLPAIKHELYAQDEQQPAIIMDIPCAAATRALEARRTREAERRDPQPASVQRTAQFATSSNVAPAVAPDGHGYTSIPAKSK